MRHDRRATGLSNPPDTVDEWLAGGWAALDADSQEMTRGGRQFDAWDPDETELGGEVRCSDRSPDSVVVGDDDGIQADRRRLF
jgi:hypothetical protein